MASSIDATKPVAGTPTTQSVRDNFTAAKSEIEALQAGTGLANAAVTYPKIQNVSATDKILGRSTAGAGVVEEIACTAAGRALLDDSNAAAQRATLGSTTVGDAVFVAASAAAARTAIGVVIGTDVQAQDAELTALAGLTSAADKGVYFTGSGAAAVFDLTGYGRSIAGVADEAAFKALVNLEIGTDVQAQDAELTALAGLTSAADKAPYFTGSGTAALTDFTAAGRSMVGAANAAAQTALLSAMVGDSGAGGVKGLVPAPAAGDASKFLRGDGSFQTIPGGGDMLAANNLSDVADVPTAQDNLDVLALGVHQIASVPARAMVLPTTSPAGALAKDESTTNKVNVEYIPFSDGSTTYCGFSFRAPKSSDESGTFSVEIEWKEASGAAAHVARWQAEMQAQGDGDTIDSAWGTAVAADDTGSSGTRRMVDLSAITPGGTWAEGDMIHVRLARLGGHANDTLDVAAHLIRATVSCTIAAKNDA